MESQPLNLAHQQHRRADVHLKNNRFDEAIQCHNNAAELLSDAMKSTSSSIVLESISLQQQYHLKQKDLIHTRKEQFSRVKQALDNIKQLGKGTSIDNKNLDNSNLEVAIYKTLIDTDSLLQALKKENNAQASASVSGKINTSGFSKPEKSQSDTIEELQTLSQSLKSLVEQLVMQVEFFKDENLTLRERVNYLENERIKYLNFAHLHVPHRDVSNIGNNVIATEDLNTTEHISNPTQFDLSALKNE